MTGTDTAASRDLYCRWERRLSVGVAPQVCLWRTRQHHVAGERVFVDYAGDTLDVIDAKPGEVHPAQTRLSTRKSS